MKLQILLLMMLVLSVTTTSLSAQPPDTLWTKVYGGEEDDVCNSVQQTSDGGFILGGSTCSYGTGYSDMYLIKTDALGNLEWQNTVGGNSSEVCYFVIQTPDDCYVLGGCTGSYSANPGYDVYLVKTDPLGNPMWQQTFGGEYEDICYSGMQTVDGGFILGGKFGLDDYIGSDMYLVKTDSLGNLEWEQTYATYSLSECRSVQQTADNGYILGGFTGYYAYTIDIAVFKTDSCGNAEWDIIIDREFDVRCYAIHQTTDGGYILGGGNYIVKIDTLGNIEWEQNISDTTSLFCKALQLTDGGYLFGGYAIPPPFNQQVYLAKTDLLGNIEWEMFIGGSSSDYCNSIQLTTDGGYILGGYTYSFGSGGKDMYLVRTEDDISALVGHDNFNTMMYILHPAYPNPFNPTTTISFSLPQASKVNLSVYDVSGRLVAELVDGWRDAGNHDVTFDGSNLASGIYIYNLTAGNYTASGKMVLMK